MSDEIITITDLRRAGLCVRGLRRWALEHDLDFDDFLKNGASVEVLREYGDEGIVDRVLKVKHG